VQEVQHASGVTRHPVVWPDLEVVVMHYAPVAGGLREETKPLPRGVERAALMQRQSYFAKQKIKTPFRRCKRPLQICHSVCRLTYTSRFVVSTNKETDPCTAQKKRELGLKKITSTRQIVLNRYFLAV